MDRLRDERQSAAKVSTREMQILPLSAKTGEGFDAWISWLKEQIAASRE
jgi:Ni2+-binding GTPase involved in maturation of urease and hydrogenase